MLDLHAVRGKDYLHRLWTAIRSWQVDKARRKLYRHRAGQHAFTYHSSVPTAKKRLALKTPAPSFRRLPVTRDWVCSHREDLSSHVGSLGGVLLIAAE